MRHSLIRMVPARFRQKGGQVKLVGQTRAPGLEHQGKVGFVADGIQKFLRAEPCHPKRDPFVEGSLGEEEGPPGVFSKEGAKKTGGLEGFTEQALEIFGCDQGEKRGFDVMRYEEGDPVVVDKGLQPPPVRTFPGGGAKAKGWLIWLPQRVCKRTLVDPAGPVLSRECSMRIWLRWGSAQPVRSFCRATRLTSSRAASGRMA